MCFCGCRVVLREVCAAVISRACGALDSLQHSGTEIVLCTIFRLQRQRQNQPHLCATCCQPDVRVAHAPSFFAHAPSSTCCNHSRPRSLHAAPQLLAAGSDHVIRVWDTQDSFSSVQLLQGHSDKVHVLCAHPFDPRLVLSAAYDGRSVLWDVASGTELRR